MNLIGLQEIDQMYTDKLRMESENGWSNNVSLSLSAEIQKTSSV